MFKIGIGINRWYLQKFIEHGLTDLSFHACCTPVCTIIMGASKVICCIVVIIFQTECSELTVLKVKIRQTNQQGIVHQLFLRVA